MKKTLFLTIALFYVCNSALAECVVDLEFGTTNSYSTQPNIGGTGNHYSGYLPAGFTGPLYIWIYARATTTNSAYNDAFITAIQGNITEISSGIYGDMSWGTQVATNAQRNVNVYSSGYPLGAPDFSAGLYPTATTSGGDVMMGSSIGPFAPVANGDNVEQGDLNTWVCLGHFTYTIKLGSAGTACIVFAPWMNSTGVAYQFGTQEDGPLTMMIGPEGGYTTTGPLYVNAPEPTTSILLTAGIATMLLANWLRWKKKR
ncbi:MAG: PEP-CTERM sorting domain-containing protein [Thermoguttaceae bacterium]|jgi:hypothetical protein